MFTLIIPVKSWLHFAIMNSPAMSFVLLAILALMVLLADKATRDNLQPIPTWLTYHLFALRRNRALQMRALQVGSVVIFVLGAISITYVIVDAYLQAWLVIPFSMPLIVSLLVAILIALTPGLLGAPMIIYLKLFPPDKWNE